MKHKSKENKEEFDNLYKELTDEGTKFSSTSECLKLFHHIAQ